MNLTLAYGRLGQIKVDCWLYHLLLVLRAYSVANAFAKDLGAEDTEVLKADIPTSFKELKVTLLHTEPLPKRSSHSSTGIVHIYSTPIINDRRNVRG